MMNPNDIQELINRSQYGDNKSFGLLVSEFQALVFRLAFRLLGNEDDAKDMVQEVFVKVWLQIRRYKPQYGFSTWIYRITGNMCCDKLRSMKQHLVQLPDGFENMNFQAFGDDVETAFINKEMAKLILYFTSGLTPKQKLVFTLRDVEGLEPEEVEAISGLSAAKIKSNLYLARQYIRERINKIS
jgi:RNA polymerase sigma-70 factor (ECF subfamily)